MHAAPSRTSAVEPARRKNLILIAVSAGCIAVAAGLLWLRSGNDPSPTPEANTNTQQVVERLQAAEKPVPESTEPPVERGSRRQAR